MHPERRPVLARLPAFLFMQGRREQGPWVVVADEFKRIHADFRAAWVEYADAPFTLELFSPSSYDSRKPPFDWSQYEYLGDVRLPLGERAENFTMQGFLFVAKENRTAEVTARFGRISAEAGAALPISVRDHLVRYCPWDVSGPANWWYALLFHLQGSIAQYPDGRYRDHTLLLRPLLMSLVAIEYCGLVSDNPRILGEDGARTTESSREARSGAKTNEYAISLEDDAWLSATTLANEFGVDYENLRKRLERWRQKNDGEWVESANRRSNEPQYLYRLGAVRPIIDELQKKASSETSGKRPAE